jgi:hypothetical protein
MLTIKINKQTFHDIDFTLYDNFNLVIIKIGNFHIKYRVRL